jgi:hypothetical protein
MFLFCISVIPLISFRQSIFLCFSLSALSCMSYANLSLVKSHNINNNNNNNNNYYYYYYYYYIPVVGNRDSIVSLETGVRI